MEALKLLGCCIVVVLGLGLMLGISAVVTAFGAVIGVLAFAIVVVVFLALGLRDYFRSRKSKS